MAVAQVGRQLQQIGQRFQELEDLQDVTRAMGEGLRRADEFYFNQLRDPDYRSLPDRVQEGFRAIQDEIGETIGRTRPRAIFSQQFTAHTTAQIRNARKHSRFRQDEAMRDDLSAYTQAVTNRAVGLAGPELDHILESWRGVLAAHVTAESITEEEAGQIYQNGLEEISQAKVENEILARPRETFRDLADPELYPGLSVLQRIRYQAQAQNRFEQQEREALAAFKEARRFRVTELGMMADRGELTMEMVDAETYRWTLDESQREKILSHMGTGARVSDPETEAWLERNMVSGGQVLSALQLVDLKQRGLLSGPRHMYWENVRQRLTGEYRADMQYRHAQAEQLIQLSLSYGGLLERIIPANRATITAAMQMLTRRSAAFPPGTEDPAGLVDEIIVQFLPQVNRLARTYVRQLETALPYHTVEEIGIYGTHPLPEIGATWTREQYNANYETIILLEQLKAEMALAEQVTGSGGKAVATE